MKIIAQRLCPGQDLRRTLHTLCLERDLDAACIVTCVGSLTHAAIRFADAPGPTTLEGPFEIVSLVGTLSRHGVHLHTSLSDRAGHVIGGHLCEGSRIHTTAEIVLGVIDAVVFQRREDPQTGYRELSIEPAEFRQSAGSA